jgi:hypothetical protein
VKLETGLPATKSLVAQNSLDAPTSQAAERSLAPPFVAAENNM